MLCSLSSPTLLIRRFGAAAVLLAGWLAVPGDARAACGDYLRIPQHDAGRTHDRAAAGDGQKSGNGERPLPCRGPECSRAPQVPLAPLPPPVTIDTHEQGVLAALQRAADRDEAAWVVQETAPRPVMFGRSIFRPPR